MAKLKKLKLDKYNLICVNEGYFTDGNIALKTEFMPEISVYNEYLVSGEPFGFQQGNKLTTLPKIEQLIPKSLSGHTPLEDTGLMKNEEFESRILVSDVTEKYYEIQKKYWDIIEYYEFELYTCVDTKSYQTAKIIVNPKKDNEIVGVVMPIFRCRTESKSDKYLKYKGGI